MKFKNQYKGAKEKKREGETKKHTLNYIENKLMVTRGEVGAGG